MRSRIALSLGWNQVRARVFASRTRTLFHDRVPVLHPASVRIRRPDVRSLQMAGNSWRDFGAGFRYRAASRTDRNQLAAGLSEREVAAVPDVVLTCVVRD